MRLNKYLLLLLIVCWPALASNNLTSKTNELKKVNKQIQGLKSSLTQAYSQQTNLQKELQVTETHIGKIAKITNKTESELKKQNQILSELEKKQFGFQNQLTVQKEALIKDLRMAYILGRQAYAKLLLSQKHPQQISRTLIYYRYINAARLQIMSALDQTIVNIDSNQEKIQTHNQSLKKLEQQQQQNQLELQKQLKQRQQVLSQVKNTIQGNSTKLNELLANKRALEQLLEKLKLANTNTAFPQLTGQFYKSRGKLPWPIRGKIIQHYGSTIENTTITANGVLIAAPQDIPVRAIFPGRVVFADWLRGIGLLIIVDHGHGYMTLYGHNHSLYKKSGELVKAGDIIATVGQSGGYNKSGLYFQIRGNGQPLNPEQWCETRS